MRKYSFLFLFLFLVSVNAKINWNGRYYQNFIVFEKLDNFVYSDFNIVYLQLTKKSYNYTIKVMSSVHYYLYPDVFSSNQNKKDEGFDLERMYISFWGQAFKIKLGYFMPKWGKNYFFRPTDLFQTEQVWNRAIEQQGIKAVEGKYFFNDIFSSELLIEPQTYLQSTKFYFKNNLHIGQFDVSIFYTYVPHNAISQIGGNFKGSLYIELLGEAIYTIATTNDYKWTIGADYSLRNFMVIMEYYYHKLGAQFTNPLYQAELASHFFAQQYLYVRFMYLTDIQIGLDNIVNLEDQSSLHSLYYSQEIFNACTLFVGLSCPMGKEKAEFNYRTLGDVILNCYLNVKF